MSSMTIKPGPVLLVARDCRVRVRHGGDCLREGNVKHSRHALGTVTPLRLIGEMVRRQTDG